MAWCGEAAARERGRVTVRKGLESTGAPLPMMLESFQGDSHEFVLAQFAVQTSKDGGDLDATSWATVGVPAESRFAPAPGIGRTDVRRRRPPTPRALPSAGRGGVVRADESAAADLVPGDSGHDTVDEGDEDGDVGEVVTAATLLDEFPGVAFLPEDDVLVEVLEEPPDG